MKTIIFGSTGMVGQAILRECLSNDGVQKILTVGRSSINAAKTATPKLSSIFQENFLDFSPIESQLSGYDACFWCIGVTSTGMSEDKYKQITHDYTVAAAQTLARLNPSMTFVFISAAGSDSSESGPIMWARIKGKTENAVFKLPFKASYSFRPAMIIPMHGIESRTASYRILYKIFSPLNPLIRLASKYVTDTDHLAKAMLKVAQHGAKTKIIESHSIGKL